MQKKRHLSRKLKKSIYYIVLISILVFVIYSVLCFFNDFSPKTSIPERTIFYDQLDAKGILILKQEFINLQDSDDIQIFVKEGERVRVNGKLFQIVRYSDSELATIKELEKIKEALGEGSGLTSQDYFYEVEMVKEYLAKGDLDNAKVLIEDLKKSNTELQFKDNKNAEVLDIKYDEEGLKSRKAELESVLSNLEGEAVRSPISGIVSYSPTRFGKKYNFENFEEIRHEDFEDNIEESDEARRKEIRVIDNFDAIVALQVKDFKDLEKLDDRKAVLLSNSKIGEIRANILEVKKDSQGGILFVKISDEIHNFYQDEIDDYKIILNTREAFILPLESLIEDDRGQGVYIKYKASIVKYRPVEVITKKGDFVYVSVGDGNSTIENKITGKREYTIGTFDEVFINHEGLKEDMVVR